SCSQVTQLRSGVHHVRRRIYRAGGESRREIDGLNGAIRRSPRSGPKSRSPRLQPWESRAFYSIESPLRRATEQTSTKRRERRPAQPAVARGVEANSRWSSASGHAGVIAKREAARTPPYRRHSKRRIPEGCGIVRRKGWRHAGTPSGVRISFVTVSGGVAPP